MVRESLLELLGGKQPYNTWIFAQLGRPDPFWILDLLIYVCVCVCIKEDYFEVIDLFCTLIVFVIICHHVFVKSHRSVK